MLELKLQYFGHLMRRTYSFEKTLMLRKIEGRRRRVKVKSESEVAQSCPTLRDPMDCSLSGSSAHGIFQAGIMLCVWPNRGVHGIE